MATEAHRLRIRGQQEMLAWHVVHVINLVASKPVSIADLCPWLRKPIIFTPAAFDGNIELMQEAVKREQERRRNEVADG